MVSIPKTITQVKPAAIWARVSTFRQGETSLPSQVSRCQEKLQAASYSAIRIFAVDFSSLDLYSSPDFQELRRLVLNHEIEGLAIYDRDRLLADGVQRLVFLSELKSNGVELLICQGPELFEGPEGKVVEMVLAVSKERQVLRASQGSRDGLHDRVALRKLPITFHKLYGYQWDRTGKHPRLIPNGNYDTIKLIFELIIGGNGYDVVIKELKRRGIQSPSGQLDWNKTALSNIINNPVYAGRYFGLRRVATIPAKRRGNTYGKSSIRKRPLSEAIYIPEIEIVNPPITWEQRGLIQDQLAKHQKLASRNAKHDYLLRGMIFCGTHRGKNGEPRRYHGQPKRGYYLYTCPVGGCHRPTLNGPEMDKLARAMILVALANPFKNNPFLAKLFDKKKRDNRKREIQQQLKTSENKEMAITNKLARVADDEYSGRISRDVRDQLWTQYTAEQTSLKQDANTLLDELAVMGQGDRALDSLEEMAKRWLQHAKDTCIALGDLPNAAMREILTQFQYQVRVKTKDEAEAYDKTPGSHLAYVERLDYRDYEITLSIPLKTEGIALAQPEHD